MSITLNWGNPNQNTTAVAIYRSSTPIDQTNPGEPLVSLAGTAVTYTDGTAADNTLYYYCIAVTVGGETVYGNNTPMANMVDTGPGPQTLVRGNWDLGFFGKLPGADMWVSAGDFLAAATGSSSYTYVPTIPKDLVWYKLAYKGKVVYVPSIPIATGTLSVIAAYFYNKGMFYGTPDAGLKLTASLPTSGSVLQNTLIPKGPYNFIARAPKAAATIATSTTVSPSITSGEALASEILSLMFYALSGAVSPNISNITAGAQPPAVYDNAEFYAQVGTPSIVLTQHFNSTANIVCGYLPANAGAAIISSYAYSVNTGVYWPILELVP